VKYWEYQGCLFLMPGMASKDHARHDIDLLKFRQANQCCIWLRFYTIGKFLVSKIEKGMYPLSLLQHMTSQLLIC